MDAGVLARRSLYEMNDRRLLIVCEAIEAADAVVDVDAWRGFSPPRMVAPRSRVVTVSSRMCPWCAASPSRSACVERGETDGELAVLKYAEVVGELRVIPLSSRMSGGC